MKTAAELSEDGWNAPFSETHGGIASAAPLSLVTQPTALAGQPPISSAPTAPQVQRVVRLALHKRPAKTSLGEKRFVDVLVSTLGLVMLSPFLMLIALAVRATSRGPAIYYSPRVGRHGQIFMMPKYRTMLIGSPTCARESAGCSFEITSVGKMLRRFGLDELPQLISVLRGDMSLIGPRPLLADDPGSVERAKFPTALEVRPGISGLAQVSGRNAVPARRKARLDAFYARTASLGFDLILVAKTVGVVISGKGFL